MWRFVVVCALALGCYAPSPPTGAACSPNGSCPGGLVCAQPTLTCERSDGAAPDAGRDGAPDGPLCIPAAPGVTMFALTGAIQTFTVPTCGPITIEAWGAQGGAGFATHVGGKGAHVVGTFTLPVDSMLSILVGGEGSAGSDATSQRSGTGGGGTFIVQGAQTPLVVAGGGGGGVGGNYSTADGGPGQAGAAGQNGDGNTTMGIGGMDGNGGTTYQIANPGPGAYHQATAGAGLLTDGMGASNGGANFGTPNLPPKAFVHGGDGGIAGSQGRGGGFGGGGSGGFTGGGGGGYSGGGNAGGMVSTHGGGGGGSFTAGASPITEAGINAGNGKAIIRW